MHFERLKEQVVQDVCKACISSHGPNQQLVEERAVVEIYVACSRFEMFTISGEFSEKGVTGRQTRPKPTTPALVRTLQRESKVLNLAQIVLIESSWLLTTEYHVFLKSTLNDRRGLGSALGLYLLAQTNRDMCCFVETLQYSRCGPVQGKAKFQLARPSPFYQMPGNMVYRFFLYLSPNSLRYLRSFFFAHCAIWATLTTVKIRTPQLRPLTRYTPIHEMASKR